LILIDDVADKGKLAVPWLQAHGYTTMHAGYQALMRRNF
jgi:hypothetical protein